MIEVTSHSSDTDSNPYQTDLHARCLRKRPVRPISRREIEDMNEKVKSELARNRKKYQKLVAMNPYFSMKLYTPTNNFSQEELNSTAIDLMLKQMDLLMDDGNLLEKEIKKSELRRMQSDCADPNQLEEWKHHYACLRKVWLSPADSESLSNAERIEELNVRVATIKNNVYSMTAHEKRCYEARSNDEKYEDVTRKISALLAKTHQFQSLRESNEVLLMAQQEAEARMEAVREAYEAQLSQQMQLINRLKEENEEFRRNLKEAKERMLGGELRESKLQFRIGELENELRERNKKQTITSNQQANSKESGLQQLKDSVISMQSIKFRKIEKDMQELLTRKDSQQKEKEREVREISFSDPVINSNPSIQLLKESQSLPRLNIPDLPERSGSNDKNEGDTEDTLRGRDLNDAKSIDGKRNRFVRMRSPVNSKLAKDKLNQEMGRNCQSPKLNIRRESETISAAAQL